MPPIQESGQSCSCSLLLSAKPRHAGFVHQLIEIHTALDAAQQTIGGILPQITGMIRFLFRLTGVGAVSGNPYKVRLVHIDVVRLVRMVGDVQTDALHTQPAQLCNVSGNLLADIPRLHTARLDVENEIQRIGARNALHEELSFLNRGFLVIEQTIGIRAVGNVMFFTAEGIFLVLLVNLLMTVLRTENAEVQFAGSLAPVDRALPLGQVCDLPLDIVFLLGLRLRLNRNSVLRSLSFLLVVLCVIRIVFAIRINLNLRLCSLQRSAGQLAHNSVHFQLLVLLEFRYCSMRCGAEIAIDAIAAHGVAAALQHSFLNQMLLSKPGEYVTFKQATEAGSVVRKGEKAQIVVFWKPLDVVEKDKEGKPVKKTIPLLKYYNVFHIDQCENLKPRFTPENLKPADPISEAETILADYSQRSGCRIIHEKQNKAFYRPSTDEIHLPLREQFPQIAEYYSTAFHEVTHSTGHKSRLDRLSSPAWFGSENYSKEELIAEMGAAILMNELGIETAGSFKNSAAYIQSWLRALKDDNKMIVSAASKAEKAVKLVLGIEQPADNMPATA